MGRLYVMLGITLISFLFSTSAVFWCMSSFCFSYVHFRFGSCENEPFILCSEKVALQALKASDWHLEGAFDVFYSHPQFKSFTDTRHLEELYNRYKGKFKFPFMSILF